MNSFGLMFFAVLLWSFVPVVFSLSGVGGFSSSLVFVLLFNFFGALLCFVVLLLFGGGVGVFKGLWGFLKERRFNFVLLFFDGFFIVVSNVFFVWALVRGGEVFVLFVSEVWPVFVFLILGFVVGGFKMFKVENVLPVFLAVFGLFVLMWGEGLRVSGFDSVSSFLAFVSALGQAGTVVVHQKILNSFDGGGGSVANNVVLQFSRQVSAVMVSGMVFAAGWFSGFNFFDNFTVSAGGIVVLSLIGGSLVVCSAVLHSRSLQLSRDSSNVILWLFGPVFSSILLVVFVDASLTLPLIVGGGFIVLGNFWLNRQR